MRVLVTGGTGVVGYHTVAALVDPSSPAPPASSRQPVHDPAQRHGIERCPPA
jgi:nucleoside-diphosphate-sugar epimerase